MQSSTSLSIDIIIYGYLFEPAVTIGIESKLCRPFVFEKMNRLTSPSGGSSGPAKKPECSQKSTAVNITRSRHRLESEKPLLPSSAGRKRRPGRCYGVRGLIERTPPFEPSVQRTSESGRNNCTQGARESKAKSFAVDRRRRQAVRNR